jgi:hypothetical protein
MRYRPQREPVDNDDLPPAEVRAGAAPDLPQAPPAIRTLEAAIRDCHVVEVEYVTLDGEAVSIRGEPHGIRRRTAGGHRLLFIWELGPGQPGWRTLILDGITAVTDTGDVFTPRRDWTGS